MRGRGWWYSGRNENCPNRVVLGRMNQVQKPEPDITMYALRQIYDSPHGNTLEVRLPQELAGKSLEVIILVHEDSPHKQRKRRSPPANIAGKGKTLGDLLEPVVDDKDWESL